MKLVFATNNSHKIHEVTKLVGDKIEILSLRDIGCMEDPPEEQLTLEGNASQKAFYIFKKYGWNCFADDTGLEVEALCGEPGVFSARYAGDAKDSNANIDKLLSKMDKINDREARFRTVISLIINGVETLFEGEVHGKILRERRGSSGFGYDPVFQPDESIFSFAEMPLDEKNRISHRARATLKLVDFLLNENFMK